MSWGISLDGPKEILLRELAEACTILNAAAKSVQSTQMNYGDYASLSVEGYISWTDQGVVSSHTAHSLNITRQPIQTPAQAAAADLVPSEEAQ